MVGARAAGRRADPDPSRFVLLAPLGPQERHRVLAAARRRRYRRDEVVFWSGDPSDAVHLIDRGYVAVQTTTRRGDVATVRLLGPSDHFGELAAVSPAPRTATIRAITPVETLVISAEDFQRLREHPEIDRIVVDALVDEIRRLSGALTDALYLSAHDHLWKRLAGAADVFGGTEPETTLPLTQGMLATLAGVSRQTANGFLDEAEASGVIRRDERGRVTVVDREQLARNAGAR